MAALANEKSKQVIIIEGGPGSGKSVVAINLLVALTGRRLVAKYVTKNAAPRTVFESVLAGTHRKSQISNLFSGSGAFTETRANVFDALVVDEAHRLNEKSGLYGNLGNNQIQELIGTAKCSIFFLDEDQRVTFKDMVGNRRLNGWLEQLVLQSQRLNWSRNFGAMGRMDIWHGSITRSGLDRQQTRCLTWKSSSSPEAGLCGLRSHRASRSAESADRAQHRWSRAVSPRVGLEVW